MQFKMRKVKKQRKLRFWPQW